MTKHPTQAITEGTEKCITIDTPKNTYFITGENNNNFVIYMMRAFAHGYYSKPPFTLKKVGGIIPKCSVR